MEGSGYAAPPPPSPFPEKMKKTNTKNNNNIIVGITRGRARTHEDSCIQKYSKKEARQRRKNEKKRKIMLHFPPGAQSLYWAMAARYISQDLKL